MKGSPLLQSALVALGFLALGIPVARLTTPKPVPSSASRSAVARPAASTRHVEVTMESLPPARMTVALFGKILLESSDSSHPVRQILLLPSEDAPLVLTVTIPEGRLAARLEVRADGEILAAQTFWGDGSLRGVLEVPGERNPTTP